METTELLKKVRKIEIKTRGLSKNIFAGEYHSAFKGRGMTFSEVREYQYGDDIRNIDWNVTARFNNPYIKIFEEEREMTVILLVDVSGSGNFGTDECKRNIITEIAATLSFSAIQNNDKIGVIFFSDKIERFIPPKKGRKHILRIIRELISCEPESKKTDIGEALRFLTNAIKKRSTVFVLSDFMSSEFTKPLQIASYRHDVVALKIFDKRETELPKVGLLKLKDAETGKYFWINSSNKKQRTAYSRWWKNHEELLKKLFTKTGVGYTTIRTGEDYVKPLLNFFKSRS